MWQYLKEFLLTRDYMQYILYIILRTPNPSLTQEHISVAPFHNYQQSNEKFCEEANEYSIASVLSSSSTVYVAVSM